MEDTPLNNREADRRAFFNDPAYRQATPILEILSEKYDNRPYKLITENSFLALYLSNGNRSTLTNLIIERELNNPEINWFAIFDYLEKQVKTKTWLTEESAQLYNRLMPYQTRLNSRLLNY